jgi:hypothetical protein
MTKPRQVQGFRDWPRKRWSISALNTLVNICAFKFKCQYIDRKRSRRAGPSLVLGSALDQTVFKPFYEGSKAGKPPDREHLEGAFRAYMEEKAVSVDVGGDVLYPKKKGKNPDGVRETMEDWIETGLRMIGIFLKEVQFPKVAQTDFFFVVPIVRPDGKAASKLPMVGIMDLVCVGEGGRMILIDDKATGQTASDWERDHDLQAIAYCYAMSQIHPEIADNIEFRWHYNLRTSKGGHKVKTLEPTPEHYEYLFRMVELGDQLTRGGVYVPHRKFCFSCNDCGFREECDAFLGRKTEI